ncbi:DNA helicase MCM8 [Nematocida displodere]|uniref:DNA helicase MCM8 n=1 Tax=Nematocida displodere TaxID=1805483 RepID=A0A177EJV9_9MICR|nr:DNA helicase MCM8 [Nematocida displodere]
MEYTRMYFPEDAEADAEVVERFYSTISEQLRSKAISLEDIENGLSITMEYLSKHLETVDRSGIDHLRCALTKILLNTKEVLQKCYIKITDFSTPVPFSHLRHTMVGKLFSLAGVVARIESAKPMAETVIFTCGKCGEEFECQLKTGGIFEKPKRCLGKCLSKNFILQKDSIYNRFSDYQRIRLHEICLAEEGRERSAGVVDCILNRSFVNTLLPGDAIHVLGTGIAEENELERYTLAVAVNNLTFLKQRDVFQETSTYTPQEMEEIHQLSTAPDLLPLLTSALFHHIVGHTEVKEGVLLSLVGGTGKKDASRKEIHTLMIGDPGMGKSKVLRLAASVLPRSNYVCGTTCTSGGLGVSIHSKAGGEYALEAGALVLSDLGHCFIDELDKLEMPQILFESMERQKISLAKAGLVCTMPTRTSVIAAANPVFGNYQEEKSLSENLSFSEAFLARFDLVFLMIDHRSSSEADSKVTSYILQTRSSPEPPTTSLETARRYIQYAREQIHPVLSTGAKSLLISFYTEIRNTGTYNGRHIIQPPTPRLIDALTRLAEAKAKIFLRPVASTEDLTYAIALCTTSHPLKKTLPRAGPKTKQSIHLHLLNHLHSHELTQVTHKELQEQAQALSLPKDAIEGVIEHLNAHGYLIKKGGSVYHVPRPGTMPPP